MSLISYITLVESNRSCIRSLSPNVDFIIKIRLMVQMIVWSNIKFSFEISFCIVNMTR
jgi:hypothetical protein